MSLLMEVCSNCLSDNLICTKENISCLDCSRVNSFIFEEDLAARGCKTDKENAFLNEISERYFLSEKEKNSVLHRLNKLVKYKSVFSKTDLTLALIYIAKAENEYVISPQAFSKNFGGVISPKHLNACINYLCCTLNLHNATANSSWSSVLEPLCERFVFLKSYEVDCLKKLCERLRHESNLSLFSIVTVAFALCYVHFKEADLNMSLKDISTFAKISKTTLKKNYLKYAYLIVTL